MVAPQKIFYKGKENDFIIFIEDENLVQKFKKGDSSIPLIDIVSIYKVFVNRQRGAEGVFDEASKLELSNNFDTTDVDHVIKKILTEGSAKHNTNLGKGLDGDNGANDGN